MINETHIPKQQLISESAHALRGLVGTILNNAGFIVRGIDPELVIEDAKEIHTTTKKLSGLIDTVIEILECGNKEYHWITVDIAELVEETCFRLHENSTPETKAYKSLVSCLLPKVRVDGETICRVLELLLSHQTRVSKREAICIHARTHASSVVVTIGGEVPLSEQIADLPPSHMKNDLGLDLLLCTCLLEVHGGSLWITRNSNEDDSEIYLNFSIPIAT